MQGGNDEYFGATTVTQDFGVGHASQTISFPAIGSHVAATNLSLNATATSGLAVTFASATPSICTVSGTTASLIAEGFCYINASQAGNGEYFEAPTVGQQFGVGHATQTINFPAIGARTAATTLNLSATASSGLPVTFTSTTPSVCTVSGSTAALVAFGTCAITASQAGNNASGHSEYFAASVTQKFSVAHASQTITFPTITTQYLYMPLTLVATASSGLPVSFISINTATCTVSGNVATMLESESYCDIEALQSGNNEYLGAPSVTQRFFINIK